MLSMCCDSDYCPVVVDDLWGGRLFVLKMEPGDKVVVSFFTVADLLTHGLDLQFIAFFHFVPAVDGELRVFSLSADALLQEFNLVTHCIKVGLIDLCAFVHDGYEFAFG